MICAIIQGSPFIMLCLGSMESFLGIHGMDLVIGEGIVLQTIKGKAYLGAKRWLCCIQKCVKKNCSVLLSFRITCTYFLSAFSTLFYDFMPQMMEWVLKIKLNYPNCPMCFQKLLEISVWHGTTELKPAHEITIMVLFTQVTNEGSG